MKTTRPALQYITCEFTPILVRRPILNLSCRSADMTETSNVGDDLAALRQELAAKEEELARTLDRLKLADARIHELEAGASEAPVGDSDRFDAAACRARLVESGGDLSASRFPMIF